MRRDMPATAAPPATPDLPGRGEPEPGTPEHRRAMLSVMTGMLGMPPDVAAQQYAEQLAAWQADRLSGVTPP